MADTNFLIQNEDSNSPTKASSSQTKSTASMCVVDESVFKIPSNYRCTNRYYSGEQKNFIDDKNSTTISRESTGASSARASNHLQSRFNQPRLDEDDIMLQIAIQQSLSYSDGDVTSDLPNIELSNEFNGMSTAILPIRDSSGSTQSLQEYQERRNNLACSQNDEDMLLQK